MQYVICKFRADDKRGYTYHWNGNPLAKGAEVKVPDKSGDGWVRVIVDSTTSVKPHFDTKPILGLAPPAEAKELDLAPKCTCPPKGSPPQSDREIKAQLCPVHPL